MFTNHTPEGVINQMNSLVSCSGQVIFTVHGGEAV
nr:MAG TPA: hypothetical protein [Caudoviricetes sp.]